MLLLQTEYVLIGVLQLLYAHSKKVTSESTLLIGRCTDNINTAVVMY